MENFIINFGAFAFGVVIGWFIYFTNRYRKEVQFGDLTVLVGAIGGAAVTALFGKATAVVFGAYGLGLAFGFFGYFFTLLILVHNSAGAYNRLWFLDGRRKKLDEGWEIPEDKQRPMAQ